ncbi:hypothetical protein Pcinc_031487 [Petrolisthes cinctipes]|uniref:Sushi domain-containing protein n=1 Tax=Petrolisthes cinctipes TaxID=88211 RepID=A0AAE1EWI6_PETCI|nr:hypothetical protein Pcinc_031487 [Petrolisthes cinctipes]
MGVIVDVGAHQCPALPSGAPGLRYENVTLNTYLVWCEESNETLDNHYSRHLDILTCTEDGQWFPDAPTECIVQDLASQPAQPCSSDPVDPDSVVVVKDIFNGTTSSELVGRIYMCEDNMEWLSGSEVRITQCLRGSWTEVHDECTPTSCLVERDCHDVADLHTDNDTYKVIPTGQLENEHTEMRCEFLDPEEGVWSNVLYRDGVMTMLLTVDSSGDPDTGKFFIGLDNLAALTREVNGTVRPLVFQFIFTEYNGNQHHATYDNVTIGPAPNYTLQSLGNFHGDAGNAMDVCLGQDYDSSTFWWKSTSGLTPATNTKWQSQHGGTITFKVIQLRIRPRTYDQRTCPPNYESHTGKCYKYVNTGNNDPQKSCTEDGGTLAYPETLDDLRSVESYYKEKGGSLGTVLLGLNNASGNWTAGNRFNPTSDITDLATNTTATDSQYWRTLSIDTSTASLPSFIPVDMMTMPTINEYICQYPSPTGCFTDPPQLTVNMTNCSATSGMGYGVEKCYECLPGYFLYGNASAPTMQYSKCIGVLGDWYPKDIVDCLPAEVCGEVPVPTTPGITNSSDGTNIRYLNATMSFTCPENMTTANKIPVQNITCIEDGAGLYKFDPETVLDCNVCEDEPPAVGNATLPDHNNNTIYYVNDSTPATCVEGHVFAVGVATMDLNCTQNSWTELTACYGACLMDPPIAGSNTVRENMTDIAFGTELTYTCSGGFYIPPDQDASDLVNSTVVKCNTSHQWDPPQPINCVKACVNMDPASPPNGNSSWDNVTRIVGTEVELTCPANHTFTNLSTTLTLKCEESGNWTQVDQDLIKCLIPCPDATLPPIPSNAIMEGPEAPPYWVGDAVNFTCGPGQESKKQETQLNIECAVDDGWINFDSNFTCFNACKNNPYPVDLPAYSDWNNLTRIVGTKVMYSCPSGMLFANLSSTVEVECEEMTRNWTTIDPEILICRTACPDTTLPPIPSNAIMEGPEAPPYWVGDAVNFTCGPGQESKKQETQLNIECAVDDGWINFDSNFTCFNACKNNPYPVDLPAYSDWNNLTRIVGTKVMYSCPSGMLFANLSSTVEVECEEMTRNWTTIDPEILICRTECETEPPPNPANTTRSYEPPYWQEDPLTFSCPYGYASPTGGINITITCLSNNTWTPIDPEFECIDGCSNAPPYPPGVATSTDRSVQTKGTVVTYTCEFGFGDGPMTHTSTCTEDGKWHPGAFHRCDDRNMNLENNPFGSLSILGLTGNISEVAQCL